MVTLLGEGDARIGMLVDLLDTPGTAVMLHRRDGRLRLSVALPPSSDFATWFEPEGAVPTSLWFVGARDRLALIGCRVARRITGFPSAVGEGQVSISMVVHGAKSGENYALVNGMQSVVPGLGLWLGQRAMPMELEHADGRLSSLRLDWTRGAPLVSGRRLNFGVRRGFEFADRVPQDQAVLEDQFFAQTRVSRPRPWTDHLDLHLALRDLVGLAAWEPFDIASFSVMRPSDAWTTEAGRDQGVEWRPAQVFSLTADDRGHESSPQFVFDFRDLPATFLDRWFRLRDQHFRPIQIMVTSLRQRHVPVEAQVLHVGAAFDALGYTLARAAGKTRKSARKETFKDRVQRVDAEVWPNATSTDGWVEALHLAYRGAKHGDRDLPTAQVAWEVVGASRLVFQLWVAARLGATDSVRDRWRWRLDSLES